METETYRARLQTEQSAKTIGTKDSHICLLLEIIHYRKIYDSAVCSAISYMGSWNVGYCSPRLGDTRVIITHV